MPVPIAADDEGHAGADLQSESHAPTAATAPASTIVGFGAGTLIRTPDGEVPVESLRVGDTVLSSSGAPRTVKALVRHGAGDKSAATLGKHAVVRIAANAFAQDRPTKELIVSPDHLICVDIVGEVLIPAMNFVNGATVTRALVDQIVLRHIELESHDILIANNLPVESYFAKHDRRFVEEREDRLDRDHDEPRKARVEFCRPVAADAETKAFLRERLIDRAKTLGWARCYDVDLRLIVNGEARRPALESGAAAFVFPADATEVRLLSSTFQPSLLGSDDGRTLGALVTGLTFSGTEGEPRRIDLGDERLGDGGFGVEEDPLLRWRWTSGELVLDPRLWDGLSGTVCLLVAYADAAPRGWIAPESGDTEASNAETKPRLFAVQSAGR